MNLQAVIPKVYPFKMESILNVKTQKVEAADFWLSQGKAIVQKLEVSLSERRKAYACPCCKTPVVLRHGKRRLPYFAHIVLEDAQSCKLCARKVKAKKKTEDQAPITEKPLEIPQIQNEGQDTAQEAKIIAFYPDNTNWNSTLGATSINYYVTSNNLANINLSSETEEKYNEFGDNFPQSLTEGLSTDLDELDFEFLQDPTASSENDSHSVWDEDLNIDWLLDRYQGKIPTNYSDLTDQELVKLIFEQKLSRSINNLRTRILDLKITGFNLPENILDIMSNKGLIRRLMETSQIQFERAS